MASSATVSAPKKRKSFSEYFHSMRGQQLIVTLVFLFVPLVLLFMFTYLPFFKMVEFSFFKMKYIGRRTFVGLQNYISVFTRKDCFHALSLSLYYMVGSVVQMALALLFATILSFKCKGSKFFRGALYFPCLICGISVGFIFKFFFTHGFVLDTLLSWVGFNVDKLPFWLRDESINNVVLVACSIWKYIGQNIVMFIGAIASVDPVLYDAQLVAQAAGLKKAYAHEMDTFAPHNALSETFKLIQRANKYIDENAPWALAKDMEANGARLAHVLYNLLEATRICGILLTPFMPESMEKLFAQIGVGAEARTWESADLWGELPETAAVVKGENLFPRLDLDKALADLEAAEAAAKKAEQPDVEVEPQLTETVDFDTFCKSDFRVVKVKACEAVKKSDKLLRFTLDDGTGTDRQILSGVHKYYEPEELVGKTLAAIVNLPPRKMMGLESNGMLLSAVRTEKGEEKLNLIMLDDQIPAGSKLC